MSINQKKIDKIIELHLEGKASRVIGKILNIGKSSVNRKLSKWRKGVLVYSKGEQTLVTHLPKILTIDVETAPLKVNVWSMWQQGVSLNQIDNDWFILSFAAKWLNESNDNIIYDDLRGIVHKEDDTKLLETMWLLLDEADVVLTQNGKKFDIKKINARFVMNGFQPPSSYKHIDTLEIAKRSFGFTSNKLEYMTDKLCVNKKLKHQKYPGFELWRGMLNDELEAWDECESYNKMDIISLEELYFVIAPWDTKHVNFNLYSNNLETICRCGSTNIIKYGFAYTSVSKFQRYKCNDCGAESRSRDNLFSKEKRKSLKMNIT